MTLREKYGHAVNVSRDELRASLMQQMSVSVGAFQDQMDALNRVLHAAARRVNALDHAWIQRQHDDDHDIMNHHTTLLEQHPAMVTTNGTQRRDVIATRLHRWRVT